MADNIFDLSRLKEALKKNPLLAGQATNSDNGEALFTMSLALSAAVRKIFFEKSEIKFSADPTIERKKIIQFMHRMRVEAMEKFNQPTFLAVIHFYENPAKLEANVPIGVIVVYIERRFVPEMLRMLKYPYIDYDDDAEVLDGIGAIANLIAGQFRRELVRLEYADLDMSPFKSYINAVPNGIDFPQDQQEKYEVSFYLEEQKRMVVEMIMGALPKREQT